MVVIPYEHELREISSLSLQVREILDKIDGALCDIADATIEDNRETEGVK